MKVLEWVKAHPYTSGALIIGGGLTFILLSGWFSGGGSSAPVGMDSSGMSDAEVNAAAQIQAAQIQAQAVNAQSAYGLEESKIMANLYEKQADYDYNLGLKQLDVGKDISLATINANVASQYLDAYTTLGMSTQQTQTNLALIQSQTKKKNQKGVASIVGSVNNTMPALGSLLGGTSYTPPVSAPQVSSFGGGGGSLNNSAQQV